MKRFEGYNLFPGTPIFVYLFLLKVWVCEAYEGEDGMGHPRLIHIQSNAWNPLFWIMYLIIMPFFAHSGENMINTFEFKAPKDKTIWRKL